MTDDRIQALIFGEVAETYHAMRPRYPPEAIGDVLEFGPTPENGAALEVGAGTGIATAAFAATGLHITAIEPDPAMAAVARRALPSDVEIVVCRFEEYEPGGRFDLVYAAQSWHWIEAEAGLVKAHSVLHPGGVLALIWNLEEADQPDESRALDAVYEGFAEDLGRSIRPARLRPAAELAAGLAESSLFTAPIQLRYKWDWTYSTDEFLQLQMTHSRKRLLSPDRRQELLERIAAVVDSGGGIITVRYTTNVFLARPQ
jgi:SAM-dependent methyltransferase